MNSRQFHIAIDLELDKTLDFEYPYIQSEEKDYWLNKAQDRVLAQKLFGNNVKGVAFDDSLERIDDLKPLVKNVPLVAQAYSFDLSPYIVEYDLPVDYKYYIRSFVNVTKLMRSGFSAADAPFSVEIIKRENMPRYLTVPGLNKPDLDVLKGFIEEDKLVVIHDSYTTVDTTDPTCKLTYIKEPLRFDYTIGPTGQVSDLPEHVHNQILDEAVLLLLNNFESMRTAQQAEINTKNE